MEYYTTLTIIGYVLCIGSLIIELIVTKQIKLIDKYTPEKYIIYKQWFYYTLIFVYIISAITSVYYINGDKTKFTIFLTYSIFIFGIIAIIELYYVIKSTMPV
jgi:hypothetical protein